MSREIKFRVWDEQNEVFRYWGFLPNGFSGIDENDMGEGYIKENSEQFTGLTDKNGKEIYEGDKMLCPATAAIPEEHTITITWANNHCGFIGDRKAMNQSVYWASMYGEIVGNIHE